MKSIRLSLILYFLVLLVLALAAVSGLVYQSVQGSLALRQKSIEALIQNQYDERCRLETRKLDEALLVEARTLAGLVKLQGRAPDPRFHHLYPLGMLTAAVSPNGHCTSLFWLAEGVKGPVYSQIRWLSFSLKFQDMVLPSGAEGQVTQYYQINSVKSGEWRSPSLGSFTLPFDHDAVDGPALVDWKFDDIQMNGKRLRRVAIAVGRVKIVVDPPPWRVKANAEDERPTVPPRPPPAPPEWPRFLVQGACETAKLDQLLAQFRSERDADLAEKADEAEENLHAIGQGLLLIGLLTFAASVAGGFWLVRLGLAPLQRLSEAVSQVSAKDFRLPLDSRPLPVELQPIVQRLTETLSLLQRAFAREKQAAADISHELRTPLAALLATLDVALRKPRPAEDYRKLLQECRASGRQMSQLVERMLALARLDAGCDQLRPQPVDAAALAEQCAALVRPLAEARGLSLAVRQQGPAELTADPDKLREVLTNLLHNAIEYNRPEGRVEVAVERQNGRLRLQVSDTGVGIAPEARDHVFERFYRADPSRQADCMHAGIGLAIVKGYVDLMGGSIELESTVGQGTTFTVTLPVGTGERTS